MDATETWLKELHTSDITLVCGTGVSSALSGGQAVASWIGLIQDALDYIGSLSLEKKAESDIFRSTLSGSPTTPMLVAAAEWVRGNFASLPKGEFKDWLRRTVGTLTVRPDHMFPPHVLDRRPVITTNYDHLLEDLTGRQALTWTDADHLEEYFNKPEQFVYHLHGHWRDSDSVVFGGRDYGRLESAPEAAKVLEQYVRSHHYVLVGYGAGLTDPTFDAFIRWFRENFDEWRRRIYILTKAQDLPPDISMPLRDKIAYISYGDGHSDLPAFLAEKLAAPSEKDEARAETTAAPSGGTSADDAVGDSVTQLLPSTVLSEVERNLGPVRELIPFQRDVLTTALRAIDQRSSALVSAVTGTGKTTLSRIAMNAAIAAGGASMMILPTKALVAQEFNEWETWIRAWEAADRKIRVYPASRDYPEHDSPVSKGRFEAAVAIYEKLGIYVVNGRRPLANVKLLIVDELQMLVEDRERASKLEGLLTMIRLLPREERPGILGLSATLSDESTESLRTWLGVDHAAFVRTSIRPIPLDTYVMDAFSWRKQSDAHLLTRGESQHRLPRPVDERHDLTKRVASTTSPVNIPNLSTGRLAAVLTESLLSTGPTRRILIFVPGRTSAQDLCSAIQRLLSSRMGTPNRQGSPWATGRFADPGLSEEDAEQRYAALQHSDLPLHEDVIRGMRQGVAYHSARLPAPLRRLLEEEFRSSAGILRVLVATDTLSIGVNLPADTVIATSLAGFSGGDLSLLTPADLDNKAGRAGRRGQSSRRRGEFYILVPDQRELEKVSDITVQGTKALSTIDGVFDKYVRTTDRTPRITSKYVELDDISRLVLQVLCADGFSRRPEALKARVASVLRNLLSAQDDSIALPSPTEVIERLRHFKLLSEADGKLRPSRLGAALGQSGLTLGAASALERLSRLATDGAGDIDLLYNTCRSGEIETSIAWVSLPKVAARHFPSLKENIVTYALSYCAEDLQKRRQCAMYFGTRRHAFPSGLVDQGSRVVSSELRSILDANVEEIDNRDATALLRALVAFEWSRGVPFAELKARFSSAITSDEPTVKERPVELKIHYSDVEQLCEQAAGIVRGAADVAFVEDGLDFSSRVRTLALQVEVGLPAWLAPVARMRLPQLHRNRLSCLWNLEPPQSGWPGILEMEGLKDHPGISANERVEARRQLELREEREASHRHRVTQEWAAKVVPGLGGATFEEMSQELEQAASGVEYLTTLAAIGDALGIQTGTIENGELFAAAVWRADDQEARFCVPHGELSGEAIATISDKDVLVVLRSRIQPSAYQQLSIGGTRARFVQPEQILSIIARILDTRGEGFSASEMLEAFARIRVSALESDGWSVFLDELGEPPPYVNAMPPLHYDDRPAVHNDEGDIP